MMEFFKRKKDREAAAAAREAKPTMEAVLYNHTELERKAKAGVPMTFDETEALRRYRQKDVTNQVLRLVGLLAILVVVIFAVGCFLYPYSLINFLGKDTFWTCWSNIGVYLGEVYSEDGWVKLGDIYNGIMTPEGDMVYAFGPKAPALMNFFTLGGWTIIPLATIGLIAIVVFSIYMLVYNIKDLVLVIRHLNNKTKGLVTDLANSAKETVMEVSEKEPVTKKTRKKKAKKTVEEEIQPEEISEDEEKELNKKMEAYKKELKIEEEPEAKPDNLKTLSDEDLDKLLK